MMLSLDFRNESNLSEYLRCTCLAILVVFIGYVLFMPRKKTLSDKVMVGSLVIAATLFLFVDQWIALMLVVLLGAVIIKNITKKPSVQLTSIRDIVRPAPVLSKQDFLGAKVQEESLEYEPKVQEESLNYDPVRSNIVNPANMMTEVRTFNSQLGPQGLSQPHGYDNDVQDSW